MWSRRQFLGALGASGAISALAPLLGCGAQTAGKTSAAVSLVSDEDLAAALAILDGKLEGATILSHKTHTHELSLDHNEERFDRFRTHLIVLSAIIGHTRRRIVLSAPSPEGLAVAATSFAGHAIAPSMRPAPATDVDWQKTWTTRHSDYRAPLRSLFVEAQNHGGSRVVYRSSYLHSVHTELRFLSRKQNLRTKSQRTRGGVVMGAWAGGEIATSHAQVSGQGGPKIATLSSDAIASTAEHTLSHLHARSAPSGQQEVLLSPEAATHLAYNAIAKSPVSLPNSGDYKFRLVDDPSVGYGAMIYNDAGQRATIQTLVGEGGGPLSQSTRTRLTSNGTAQAQPSHVRLKAGIDNLASLVERVQTGVLLEGPELCQLDSRGERFAIICSRAREILNGRFTGRLFARTMTTGNTSEFIANTSALGSDSEQWAFESHGIAGSAQAPHWLSRARVEKA